MRKSGYKVLSMAAVIALAVGTTACGSKKEMPSSVESEEKVTGTDGAEAETKEPEATAEPVEHKDNIVYEDEADKETSNQEDQQDSSLVKEEANEGMEASKSSKQYEVVELGEHEKFYEMTEFDENAGLAAPYDLAKYVKTYMIAANNYEDLPDGKVRAFSYEGNVTINGERCYMIAQGEDDSERFMVVNRYAVGTGENAKIYYDNMVTCMYDEIAEVVNGGNAIELIEDGKEFEGEEDGKEDAMM